jgi:hypothetical protein
MKPRMKVDSSSVGLDYNGLDTTLSRISNETEN